MRQISVLLCVQAMSCRQRSKLAVGFSLRHVLFFIPQKNVSLFFVIAADRLDELTDRRGQGENRLQTAETRCLVWLTTNVAGHDGHAAMTSYAIKSRTTQNRGEQNGNVQLAEPPLSQSSCLVPAQMLLKKIQVKVQHRQYRIQLTDSLRNH